jgi:hypothetical protein
MIAKRLGKWITDRNSCSMRARNDRALTHDALRRDPFLGAPISRLALSEASGGANREIGAPGRRCPRGELRRTKVRYRAEFAFAFLPVSARKNHGGRGQARMSGARPHAGARLWARAHAREFAKISTLGCPLCPPESSIATDGRRSLWHAAILMRLPRREAASFLCDIHPLMSSWFRTAPPARHPGFLIPTKLNPNLAPPGRCRHSTGPATPLGTRRKKCLKPSNYYSRVPTPSSSHFFQFLGDLGFRLRRGRILGAAPVGP